VVFRKLWEEANGLAGVRECFGGVVLCQGEYGFGCVSGRREVRCLTGKRVCLAVHFGVPGRGKGLRRALAGWGSGVACRCGGPAAVKSRGVGLLHGGRGRAHAGRDAFGLGERAREGHSVDALAPGGDEGRGTLRKATGSRERALIRGFPNGATPPFWGIIF